MPDQELRGVVQRMIDAGEPEANIAAVIERYNEREAAAKPEPKSLGGFAQNAVYSGGRLVRDTVLGAGALVSGAGHVAQAMSDPRKAAELGQGVRNAWEHKGEIARGLGKAAYDRYGTLDNIGNTLYNDPFGVASDVATIALPVAGGALKATQVPRLVSAGTRLAEVGAAIDPLANAVKYGAPAAKRAGTMAIQLGVRPSASVQSEVGRTSRQIAEVIQNERLGSVAGAEAKIAPQGTRIQALHDAATEAGEMVDPTVMIEALKGEPMKKAMARADVGEPADLEKLQALIAELEGRHMTPHVPGVPAVPPPVVHTPPSPDAVDAAVRNTNELGIPLAKQIPSAVYGSANPAAVQAAREAGPMANIVPRRILGSSIEPGSTTVIGTGRPAVPAIPPAPVLVTPSRGLEMKQASQGLAHESGRAGHTMGQIEQGAISRSLRPTLEAVGPEGEIAAANKRMQDLLAGKAAFEGAEARSHNIENAVSTAGIIGGAMLGGEHGMSGITAALAAKLLTSPRTAAVAGIAAGDLAKVMARPDVQALVARLRALGAPQAAIDAAVQRHVQQGGGQ